MLLSLPSCFFLPYVQTLVSAFTSQTLISVLVFLPLSRHPEQMVVRKCNFFLSQNNKFQEELFLKYFSVASCKCKLIIMQLHVLYNM